MRRILQIDVSHQLGKLHIQRKVGRNHDQPRCFLPGLPDGVACFYTALLGQLVFGEHNAMAQLLIATYSNRLMTNIQLVQTLH